MQGWAAWVVGRAAYAGIRVHDPEGCVRREALDLEIRDSLGDEAADRLELSVAVEPRGDDRLVAVRVTDAAGELLYTRDLTASAMDCALLSAVVAKSVEVGLADIPWRLAVDRPPAAAEASLAFHVSIPVTVRTGISVGAQLPIARPLRWTVDADGFVTTFAPVGSGVVQLLAGGMSTGPVLRTELGDHALDAVVRLWVGRIAVSGRSFDENLSDVLPRVSLDPELGFVARAAVRVGVRAEVPLARLAITAPGAPEPTYEPSFRVGLVLGLGGSLRRGEGRAADRP